MIESVNGKFSDGREFRLLKDLETGQIELILDHSDLQNQNQGVKSERKIDQKFQAYVLVEGFYQG
mgnify:CR=1 FL=1